MLSIGTVTAKGGRYYTDLVRPDYYTAGGESPGRWVKNRAAEAEGFRGEAVKEDVERLFDGYHPKTGEQLAKNHGRDDRRAAIDMCFSVPKTVSALVATADGPRRRQLEEAIDRAIDKTLAYVNAECGYTRRGQGGYEREKVDLFIVKYRHLQSRGQEPQLHVHSLVMNFARRADGSLGTIDAGPLFAPNAKKMLGAYFRSALACELPMLLEPDPKTRFSFRVAGVPEPLADKWSSRAKQIEEAARERQAAGGKAKAAIALETRKGKHELPLSEMFPVWQETARAHGFTAQDVERIFRQRRPELTPEQSQKIIDAAIKESLAKHAAEQAHFSRQDLLKDVCIATAARGIAPDAIRARVEETLRDPQFLSLGRHRHHERYATVETYHAIEERALEVARRLGEKCSRTVSERTVEKAIAKARRPLNEGQREAVKTVCRGSDLTLIFGPPGAGKSTLLEVARKAIEKGGGEVIGLAPSNRAARELERSSGVKSITVHRFLYDRERTARDVAQHHARMLVRAAFGRPTWKLPKLEINRKTTLIIDECAMVDNDRLGRALAHAEKAGCRVVLVGDPKQLPAIGPGGLVREIHHRSRDHQKIELTENVRQQGWAREAVEHLGRGDAGAALRTYDEQKELHFAPTRDDAERLLIERWKEGTAVRSPEGHLILASTNVEVDRLNQRAQEARQEAGRLGFRSVRIGDERIHEGDRVLFTDTNKGLGLVKSEFATVTNIDMLTRKVTVRIDGQEERVTFSLRKFSALRLGYAATTHRAQSMTLSEDAYILIGGPMASRELAYVQISRAKRATHLFSDARNRAELERILGRSDEKFSAHQIAREAERRPERQRQQQQLEQQLSL